MIKRLKFISKIENLPVMPFDGKKEYYSTGAVDGDRDVQMVTYDDRPSRANVQLKENATIVAKMKGAKKTTLVTKEMENNIYSTGFTSLRATEINDKYLFYLLSSDEFLDKRDFSSVGTTQEAVNEERLMNIKINYIDDIEKQIQVVNFLDKKVNQINELVDKHNQIIERLIEYRKSMITKTVTNGLVPNVEMKKSEIDYIEKVPKHWKLERMKFTVNYIGKGAGITKDDIKENGDTKCVRYGEIYSKYDNTFDDCYSKTNISLVSSPQWFEYGDILFAGTGELIEEIGKNIVYLGKDKCLAGGDIIILKHKQNPKYLNYLLNSTPIQAQKSCGKSKLKVVHISSSEIGDIKVYLPDIKEQKEIADYLDKKYSAINELIARQRETIEKLEEYKKTLIYNAVTGKMDIDGGNIND